MKTLKTTIAGLAVILLTLFAFTQIKKGGIRGRITPVEGVQEIQVISGKDTLRLAAGNGNFQFNNLKAGTYKVWIKTNLPYKEYTLQEVPVIDSATTDIGQIKLLQN